MKKGGWLSLRVFPHSGTNSVSRGSLMHEERSGSTPKIINLYEEWASRRYREVRLVKIWFGIIGVSALVMVGTTAWLVWALPTALKQQALWKARAEKAQATTETLPEPPLPPERLTTARVSTQEVNLVILALTRLAPRNLYLNEIRLSYEQEQGWVGTVRGGTLGFQPIQDYTERLRATQLFSDIAPLSVNRQETDQDAQWSQFEIRLVLPSALRKPDSEQEGGETE